MASLPESIERALELLHQASTPHGFLASTTDQDNYQSIWARDGSIVSLSALQTDDEKLHYTARQTLLTLQKYQGPHGEIPSNVDPQSGIVSYGGTAGRVDGNLWFILAVFRYYQRTQDKDVLQQLRPALKKIKFLLGAWEFNTKGLLYVPETGDWADEYIQHGYVLYDQLLYQRALVYLSALLEDPALETKAHKLHQLIQANYWFYDCNPQTGDAYHPIIFHRGCQLADTKGSHWMAFFSPTGYGYRFDTMANVLASLFQIATPEQSTHVDAYIRDNIIQSDFKVLPAFAPVIEPLDADWEHLQRTFSNSFKNKPYEFYNGGLWPLLNGFYVADLSARGLDKEASEYLAAINTANELDDWGFHEFIHGKTHQPGGPRMQTWSASAAVSGYFAMNGIPIL